MSILQSIKPFWPLLLTFILPRAIGFARAINVAYRTRPQPRPLPAQTRSGLNILFAAICVFLFASISRTRYGYDNIFQTTNSRLHIPTDILFARLALSRSDGLSQVDEALRSTITTPALRSIYLRFGPSTLLNCPFCIPEDDLSYLLYHLPTHLLLPHLFQFLVLGLATSTTVTGPEAGAWRFRSLLGAAALLVLDLYVATMYEPIIDGNMPSPAGIFWTASLLRPLSLCVYDMIVVACIWASATGRFLLLSSPNNAVDAETAGRRTNELLSSSNVALQMAQTKLRAVRVARNAVVRNTSLKEADDAYWLDVVTMEGMDGMQDVWEEEEVQAAMARAYGSGTIDVGRMRREADAFVRNVTKGVDSG